MCNVCGGSYTVVYENSFGAFIFQACPLCGPMPEPEKTAKNKAMAERLVEVNGEMDIENEPDGGAA